MGVLPYLFHHDNRVGESVRLSKLYGYQHNSLYFN